MIIDYEEDHILVDRKSFMKVGNEKNSIKSNRKNT